MQPLGHISVNDFQNIPSVVQPQPQEPNPNQMNDTNFQNLPLVAMSFALKIESAPSKPEMK